MSMDDSEPGTSRKWDFYDDQHSPVFGLLTPRPEEAGFNEFTPRLPGEQGAGEEELVVPEAEEERRDRPGSPGRE